MKRNLLIAAFLALSIGLALWLFANWYVWSMADFDCGDGYWNCRRDLVMPMALKIGLSLLVWGVLVGRLIREWKRS